MDKVLVTGSNGLLGQKLVAELQNSGYEVIATSQGENRISSIEVHYESLDITDKAQVADCVARHQPSFIVNTAAMTNVDACEDDPEGCERLNVEAVRYLVEAANANRVHLIHLSTDFIFDGEAGPYSEEDEPNPLSTYAKSKVASEELVRQSCEKWSIARTIIVYGTAEALSRSNIVLWGREALKEGKPLNIVDDQYRMPTLAEDLAIGCRLIIDHKAEGVFHLCGPDFMSIYELIERMAVYYGKDTNLINRVSSATLNQRAHRPHKTGFKLDKARNVLGYTPRTLEEGLALLDKQLSQQ